MPRSSKAILHERRIHLDADRWPAATGWVIAGLFVGGMIAVVRLATGNWAGTAAVVGVLVAIGWISSLKAARRKQTLARERKEESICGFARAFDRHTSDPVILRAVYETVQARMGPPVVPIRAADRFLDDLDLDGDDLDDIYGEAALLAGRSTADAEKNPVWGGVKTVGDLVTFLHHQARLE